MDICYRNTPVFLDSNAPSVSWLTGTLVNNNTAIQNPDSTFLSVQPDGTFQTRTAIGPWETCSLNQGNNTVTYAATGLSYVIPIKGR